ncbi:MAG: orotate phosphoribosyltransferase [Proteobacteria bacterium]|nr:orotate phosphoribosyltransferase [Pseudomonadota bacterium]
MSIANEFIQLSIKKNVLRFGDFTLKSGRVSPYFFNAGLFDDGESLSKLGEFYAKTIHADGLVFDMLYGPAYKGIPLATAISMAYLSLYNINLPVCFNRKEIKKHGEGGQLIGAAIKGRVLIVDDVVSAGTSVKESIKIIKANNAVAVGIAVALDRQEIGESKLSAMQELEKQFKIKAISIANLDTLLDYLSDDEDIRVRVEKYRAEYGL